jgi:2-amino-4-hydroxy-6-hydroxymethyldihydropteridine diphosphokinase
MTKTKTAYIGVGSNLGDRKGCIDKALKMMAEAQSTKVVRVSDLAETEPLGAPDHPKYLNGVLEVETTLSAEDLYKMMAEIENALGRERPDQWAPRTIDLDLLLFGGAIVNTDDLTVPHPQMHLRSFVLAGMCQLNPDLLHPVLKESMSILASRLAGRDFARDGDRPQLVSIAGIIGVGKTTLAKKLAQALDCRPIFEAYDENPFLPDVYAGHGQLALDSQLFFLTSRLDQLSAEALTAPDIIVSDYVFDKELIYARCLLDKRQLTLYEKLYEALNSDIAAPSLVIYLKDSAGRCLERIHKRNRPYEQAIVADLLERLNTGYEQLFADWKRSPVITISMPDFDSRRKADVEHLKNQVTSYVAV